jgi:hypothetical protein
MATQYLTTGDVCTELVQWRMFRRDGLTSDEAAALMGLSPSTAADYERTVLALAALKTDATPSQARPEVAEAPTQ